MNERESKELGLMKASPELSIDCIPELVRDLYKLVAKFEALFPERKFTPDGHLVGSIG